MNTEIIQWINKVLALDKLSDEAVSFNLSPREVEASRLAEEFEEIIRDIAAKQMRRYFNSKNSP